LLAQCTLFSYFFSLGSWEKFLTRHEPGTLFTQGGMLWNLFVVSERWTVNDRWTVTDECNSKMQMNSRRGMSSEFLTSINRGSPGSSKKR
jgi:hypothetical protein